MASKSMTAQLFGPSTLLDLVKGIRAANNDSAAYSEWQRPGDGRAAGRRPGRPRRR